MCRRLEASKGEMRISRWTPISPLQIAVGVLPGDLDGGRLDARLLARQQVDDLGLEPRALAQRRYMRMSICAQSCDSVPPAPGWMERIAGLGVVRARRA